MGRLKADFQANGTTFCHNAAIYNVLANDTTFSGYLGTTTFTNGATADSVFILTPEEVPQVKSQVGLECIIHDSGDVTRKDYVNDAQTF